MVRLSAAKPAKFWRMEFVPAVGLPSQFSHLSQWQPTSRWLALPVVRLPLMQFSKMGNAFAMSITQFQMLILQEGLLPNVFATQPRITKYLFRMELTTVVLKDKF